MLELNQDNWTNLINADGGERLSILIPTEKAGPPTRKNPIRFKNSIAKAEDLLGERGLNNGVVDELLGEARSLVSDYQFWQHQREGLAIYIDQNGTRVRRTMLPMPDRVTLAPRFYVVPLVREFMRDTTLYLLALSAGSVRLFRVTRRDIRPVELRDTPESLDEMMAQIHSERHLQFHTGSALQGPPGSGSSRPATFHGQGASGDDDEHMVRLKEYCRMVDAGVVTALAGEHAPLMLAAADPIRSVYRNTASYPKLVEQELSGNPESIGQDQMRQKALRAFEPMWDAERLRAAERFLKLSPGNEATDVLQDVVIAAHDGRVDTLLIRNHDQQRGAFLEQDRLVEHDKAGHDNEDLLNLAAVYTLRTAGEVHVMAQEEMPTDHHIAAILRYAS